MLLPCKLPPCLHINSPHPPTRSDVPFQSPCRLCVCHNTFALKAASAVQVRDRATLYLSQLTGSAEEAVQPQWDVPAKNLEASLRAYLQNGATQAFDLVSLSPLCLNTQYMAGSVAITCAFSMVTGSHWYSISLCNSQHSSSHSSTAEPTYRRGHEHWPPRDQNFNCSMT